MHISTIAVVTVEDSPVSKFFDSEASHMREVFTVTLSAEKLF